MGQCIVAIPGSQGRDTATDEITVDDVVVHQQGGVKHFESGTECGCCLEIPASKGPEGDVDQVGSRPLAAVQGGFQSPAQGVVVP